MLASPASFAVSASNSSVGNFVVTLTDLDLTDGITPYFQFAEHALPRHLITEYQADNNSRTVFDIESTASWQPIEIETRYQAPAGGLERFTAAGRILGSTLPELQVNTSASATGNQQLGAGRASAQIWDRFTLSPNTGLSVTFDLTANSALGGPAGMGGARSWAVVEFTGDSFPSQDFNQSYRVGFGSPDQGTAGTITPTFNLTSDGSELLVTMRISAGSVGSNYNNNLPPPIPEPETYAMLLAGLGLVGASAARRRKQRGI